MREALEINARGFLVVRGRASFWANFVINVPLAKYRSILFDDVDLEFLSLHPESGQLRKAFEVGGGAGQYVTNAFNDAIGLRARRQCNQPDTDKQRSQIVADTGNAMEN